MDWKFWKKNNSKKDPSESTLEKLSRSKDLPDQIGMHLVAKLGKSPDWVWSLKAVERSNTATKNIIYFRIFDPGKAANARVAIKDYYSLDEHPELILFEGRMDKKLRKLQIEEKAATVIDTKAA
jgi:hypothetical protein